MAVWSNDGAVCLECCRASCVEGGKLQGTPPPQPLPPNLLAWLRLCAPHRDCTVCLSAVPSQPCACPPARPRRYQKLQGRLKEEKRAAKLLRAQLAEERAASAGKPRRAL